MEILLASALSLLICQERDDGGAHFFERLGVSGFAVQHFNNVEAVLCLHQVGNRALRYSECGLFEFRHGLFFNDPAKVAALRLGGIIF